MSQAMLRERIDEAIDALIEAAAGIESAEQRFLSNLDWAIDQQRIEFDDILAGLIGGSDAFDRSLAPDVRYSPQMIEAERTLRALTRRFAASAIDLITEKLEVEAAAEARNRARLLALQRVGAAVTSSLDVESTLHTIVTEAASLMNGATARLRLADETGEHLRLIASSGELDSEDSNPAVPVETTLAGLSYRSGRPVISNDVAADPRGDQYAQSRQQTRSLLSVPLTVRGTATGVLTISNISDRAFEESDAEILGLFADHAAIAIENARLFEEAQAQITEMEIINRVSAVVSSSLNLNQIYRSIHHEIARIMIADAFLIVIRTPEGRDDLVYIVDLGQTFSPRHNITLPIEYLESMSERKARILDASQVIEYDKWERYGDMSKRVQSMLVAPLVRGNDVIGCISAQSYAPNSYRRRDTELLWTVANVAAVAIENAMLFEQASDVAVAEERNRLAREIHDTIAQGLVGIILQLEAIGAQVESSPLSTRIDRAIALARANLDEARRSVRDLRAAPLEHLSLIEAIEQLAEQHMDEVDTRVMIDSPVGLPLLDDKVEAAIYRFVQECLTNCRKHARNAEVNISVYIDVTLNIEVRDNGPGFDLKTLKQDRTANRFGVLGMRERAERLGGTLEIDSVIGSGTRLAMSFPYDRQTDRN
ncbi:MAG: GAF domain-containing sensor histidine kinase [Thermomicrobiales bacterium]|nr:GAF domain-containing sensor histidine kinase [Thermomicrobiales bacterium]